MTPTATIDTNIPQELWRSQERAKIVESLIDLAFRGCVDLAVTTRIELDIPNPPLSDRIRELPQLGITSVGAPARWGVSTWGGGDVWGSDLFEETHALIEDQLEGERVAKGKASRLEGLGSSPWSLSRRTRRLPDVGHRNHRNCFRLESEGLGITVMKPEQYLITLTEPKQTP